MAEFLTVEKGLCVQIMHMDPFDKERVTVALPEEYLQENGCENDRAAERLHHEIYLSDARKAAPDKWKNVIRPPVRRKVGGTFYSPLVFPLGSPHK